MVTLQVSEVDYQIISSILKIGKNARYDILWSQLVNLMNNLGFTYCPGGHMGKGRTAGGRGRFVSKIDGKILRFCQPRSAKLETFKQDELKKAFERILGWSESSFATA